ncbi:MAG: chlorite dismutase family protein, partial [Planctomycetota bacterium]
MNRPPAAAEVAASRIPTEGWHCGHYYYSIDRALKSSLTARELDEARQALVDLFDPSHDRVKQLQLFAVSGHKADFGFMALDPDPLNVDRVHQELMASRLGPALQPTYSFVSLTEVSEYVPTVEQFGNRLVSEGMSPEDPAYAAKVKAYAQREPMMKAQRLTPDIPDWPAMCFYPMNKKRKTGENWFTTPFSQRTAMMSEHARSGMAFAGKVTQLITVSVGLDDWEWGVTLWATNPLHLKQIVYDM